MGARSGFFILRVVESSHVGADSPLGRCHRNGVARGAYRTALADG